MIETKIDELIAALDRNTAALSAKPAVVTKSVKTPVKAPAKSEEEVVAAAVAKNEAAEVAKDDELKSEHVKAALDKLLKANKRQQAIDLLKSFNGAVNVTGVVNEGQEAMRKFIDEADEILLAD